MSGKVLLSDINSVPETCEMFLKRLVDKKLVKMSPYWKEEKFVI